MSNARGACDLPSFSNLAASSNMNNDACKRGDDDSSYFSDSSTGSYARRKRAGAVAKTSREGDAKQFNREKENKPPSGAAKRKVKKSKSSNVSPGGQFGHGHHRRRGRFFAPSPIGRPMILSRRLSYRINNSTPMKSPITATTLNFTPNMRRRPGRHYQSSLERIGLENKPAAKRSKASNKHNSV